MVLYEDTRQQAYKHENIRKYCLRHDIEIIRQALNPSSTGIMTSRMTQS